jgi:O-methyltransferase
VACALPRPFAIEVEVTSVRSSALHAANRVLGLAGLEIRRVRSDRGAENSPLFPDVEPWVAEIIEKVRPFTMTSCERVSALAHAVRYVVRANVPGDIVECGVWRGGSMMTAAFTLQAEGDVSRTLHLFDTFEGMPPPSAVDRLAESGRAASAMLEEEAPETSLVWARAHIEDVRANLASTGYPADRTRFIVGRVEETIPEEAPERIAVLRLDTDWYESTKHELINLYPRLSIGGVLIVDDYGWWEGARKAVDEYLVDNRLMVLLQRIDDTGRIAVKTGPIRAP